MALRPRMANRCFELVHGRALVYNTCWEDPRLDHAALELGPDDTVVVITSAGCNALDYALSAPRSIAAVDINPRQNALLALKQAAIRALPFAMFFRLFGRGRLLEWLDVYHGLLRPQLVPWMQNYWDRRAGYFVGRSATESFYFHGAAGRLARAMNIYLDRRGLRPALEQLLEATSLESQRDIYDRHLRHRIWTPFLKWILGRDATLAFLAVPRAQREHLERQYERGIASFIEERIETVLTRIPIVDNYFWRVYLTGGYTADCCPQYLTRDGFNRLKAGLVDRISVHTASLQAYLDSRDEPVSRFVLLDHMDWLSDAGGNALAAEWQAILRRATPDTRILWRSGGRTTPFVDGLRVERRGRHVSVGSLLTYAKDLADRLHALDRVHTYGSFHIAHLAG